MTKYHISSDGVPNPCSADKKPCPLGADKPHFETKEAAREHYEKSKASKTITKPLTKNNAMSQRNEFQIIEDSFPNDEVLKKYHSIVKKYGKDVLLSKASLIDHKELFANPDELFFLYSFMNAQQKASSIERFIYTKLGGTGVKSSLDRGDAKIKEEYYEIKTSTTNKNESLNIRQIRLYQDVDYYICSYINERSLKDSKTYLLSKAEMENEVDKIGGYTHGTIASNENKVNPEYSVTLPVTKDDKHVKRWNEKYWYNDLYAILQGE